MKLFVFGNPVPELTAVPVPVPEGKGGSAVVGVSVGKAADKPYDGTTLVDRGRTEGRAEGKMGRAPTFSGFSLTLLCC